MSDLNSTPPNKDEENQFPNVPAMPTIPEPPKAEFKRPVIKDRAAPTNRGIATMGLAGSIVFSLGVTPAAAAFIGYLIDKQFKTTPWGIATLGILGVLAGFVQMIRALQSIEEAEKKERGK